MRDICLKAIDLLDCMEATDVDDITGIAAAEQKIDDMTMLYRQNQIARMQSGVCSDEACILYSEMLTDFERIGDHILNIGQELGENRG